MADEVTTTLRRCIGAVRYGIEPHEAPVEDFPRQPSQKDGLGRMCKIHWNVYTAGLARDARVRKAAEGGPEPDAGAERAAHAPVTTPPRRRQPAATPEPGAQGDAG